MFQTLTVQSAEPESRYGLVMGGPMRQVTRLVCPCSTRDTRVLLLKFSICDTRMWPSS